MVSFWPFSSADSSSAASFEKILSQLSAKITRANTQLDSFRQKQRRYKVLWTLYSTFAYILVAAILTLVTGYQRWGAPEYVAVAGSPVVIYGVRTALDAYYRYRIDSSQSHLEDLVKQREKAIQRLKSATKYDSTQELLDKYGGTPRKGQSPAGPSQQQGNLRKRRTDGSETKQGGGPGLQAQRTGFAPPPTANIPRAPIAGPSGSSAGRKQANVGLAPDVMAPAPPMLPAVGEEFAPNAFSSPPPGLMRQPSSQYAEGPKWYDRILDVLLGEDETQAKNRTALICSNCRLVNGQAPPGARTLEEIGRWRCSDCHTWNGVEGEEKKVLREIAGQRDGAYSPLGLEVDHSVMAGPTHAPTAPEEPENNGEFEHVEEVDEEDDEAPPRPSIADTATAGPAASTRGKARKKKT